MFLYCQIIFQIISTLIILYLQGAFSGWKVILHVEIFVQNPSLPRTKVFFLFRSDTFRSDPTNIYCAVIVHEAVNPNNKLCNKNINLHFKHKEINLHTR